MSLAEGIGRLAGSEQVVSAAARRIAGSDRFSGCQRHEPRLLRQSGLRANHRLFVRDSVSKPARLDQIDLQRRSGLSSWKRLPNAWRATFKGDRRLSTASGRPAARSVGSASSNRRSAMSRGSSSAWRESRRTSRHASRRSRRSRRCTRIWLAKSSFERRNCPKRSLDSSGKSHSGSRSRRNSAAARPGSAGSSRRTLSASCSATSTETSPTRTGPFCG